MIQKKQMSWKDDKRSCRRLLIYGINSTCYLISSVLAMQYFQRPATLPVAGHSTEVEAWVT